MKTAHSSTAASLFQNYKQLKACLIRAPFAIVKTLRCVTYNVDNIKCLKVCLVAEVLSINVFCLYLISIVEG